MATSIVESGECGDGCTYTIDDDGNLKVTGNGTGTINSTIFRGKRNFKNVDIQGIASIGQFAFLDSGSGDGTVKIDNSLTSITASFMDTGFSTIDIDSTNFSTSYRAFNTSNLTLIVPPNEKNLSWATFTDSAGGSIINNLTIQCKGDVALCAKSMDNALRPLINNNKTLSMTDEAGNSVSWNDNGFSVLDADHQLRATYDKSGNILLSCIRGTDGSVMTYDKDGKLVDIKGKKILTVDEAMLLVQKGRGNTFTLRYR